MNLSITLSTFFLLINSLPLATKGAVDLKNIVATDYISNRSIEFSHGSSLYPMVLVFLSSQCPCSQSHMELLKITQREFPKFQFIGIHSNQNESLESSKEYFTTHPVGFPIVRDENSILANKLGALKTPHVFIINKQNEIVFQGGISNSSTASKANRFYLKTALESLSKGNKPDPSEVKTLGCYIKR